MSYASSDYADGCPHCGRPRIDLGNGYYAIRHTEDCTDPAWSDE